MNSTYCQKLRDWLSSQPTGRIEDRTRLCGLLADAWQQLEGSTETKMRADKLWRIETAEWSPPQVLFTIERHAQTVAGSSRATVQTWCVDVETLTARIHAEKRRQLGALDKKLDVAPIVAELVQAISTGAEHRWLKWKSPTSVALKISEIIPATNKQTTGSRRARLNKQLTAALKPHGFTALRANTFER